MTALRGRCARAALSTRSPESAAPLTLRPTARADNSEPRRSSTVRTAASGIWVREAFHLSGEVGEGIVEQIDGVTELKGSLYFVEMKWYREPVGKPEISEHLVRLMSRAEARGIVISAGEYTEPAVSTCKGQRQHNVLA